MSALLPDFNDIFCNLGIWVMIKFTKLQIWQQTTGSPKCSIGLGKWPRGSIYTPIYLWNETINKQWYHCRKWQSSNGLYVYCVVILRNTHMNEFFSRFSTYYTSTTDYILPLLFSCVQFLTNYDVIKREQHIHLTISCVLNTTFWTAIK